jgi:hypothetical protein
MKNNTELMAHQFSERLTAKLTDLPSQFYSSFLYTTTGRNLTHPLTLGAICHVVEMLPDVMHVGVDVRFNEGTNLKFQPDIVGFDDQFNPVLALDYESPNSSDARIPVKDWAPYEKWAASSIRSVPYFVITTLPDIESPDWELRWTATKQYNQNFKGQKEKVRENPFRFWYQHYRTVQSEYDLGRIFMLNIDRGIVRVDREFCIPGTPY